MCVVHPSLPIDYQRIGSGSWNRTSNLGLMRPLCNHYTFPQYGAENAFGTPGIWFVSDMMIPKRLKELDISCPFKAQGRTRTDDLRFTKALLYPTELLRHSNKFKPTIFRSPKLMMIFSTESFINYIIISGC